MPVTPLFAAIFGLMYLYLSYGVIKLRLKGQVSLGAGGDANLEKAIRVHGNFAEYVPFALLLLWLLESVSLSSEAAFILGCALLISRIAHTMGFNNGAMAMRCRQFGMIGTILVVLITSSMILWMYIPVSV